MTHSNKHQHPAFKSVGRAIATRSAQELSDPAIHAFHRISCRGQIKIGISKVRTIFIQPSQYFTQAISIGTRTQRMICVSTNARRQLLRQHRIIRGNNLSHGVVRFTPALLPDNPALDASKICLEPRHQMKMTSLQNPAVISAYMLNTANTVRNYGQNTLSRAVWHTGDNLRPSFRGFSASLEYGAQKYRVLSPHTSYRHQVDRPAFALETEPQRVNDQQEMTMRHCDIPRLAVKNAQCGGATITDSGNAAVGASRAISERLPSGYDRNQIFHAPLLRLSTPSFPPSRPSHTACDATFSPFPVSMNDPMRTGIFSV